MAGDCSGWIRARFNKAVPLWFTVRRATTSPPDPAKAARVMQAMLQMKKLDIETCRLEAREPAGVRLGGGGDAV